MHVFRRRAQGIEMAKLLYTLLLALLIPHATFAAETIEARGNLASFFTTTNYGCVTTYRFALVADESAIAKPGDKESRRTLYITEFDYDTCLAQEVRSASGYKNLELYELATAPHSVRVMTSLTMSGSAGTELRNVDLTWTRQERLASGATVYRYGDNYYRIIMRYNGISSSAVVHGSIGTELIQTTGSIDFVRAGSVSIYVR